VTAGTKPAQLQEKRHHHHTNSERNRLATNGEARVLFFPCYHKRSAGKSKEGAKEGFAKGESLYEDRFGKEEST